MGLLTLGRNEKIVYIMIVFLTERGYRTERKLLWSRLGKQKDEWLLAEVPVRVGSVTSL